MRAAIYRRTGPAADVLAIEEVPTPLPGSREVRVRLFWSGVNPSDVKSRAGMRTKTLPSPAIIPHSDGAGAVGHYAIQLAKLRGALQVVATISSEAKAARARAAGADLVVNYKTEDVARIADAHELVERGRAVGNVVLEVGPAGGA